LHAEHQLRSCAVLGLRTKPRTVGGMLIDRFCGTGYQGMQMYVPPTF
jgi:hypothetical protein